MKNITRIIFLFLISSPLALFADDSPFANLILARKQVRSDEIIYRTACYKAYSNGNNPPMRIPSAAEFDAKKWYEQCIQVLRKTHAKEISEVQAQYAAGATLVGMCTWGLPWGFLVAVVSSTWAELVEWTSIMIKGTLYFGTVSGGIAFLASNANAEKEVLEKELAKLDPTISKD